MIKKNSINFDKILFFVSEKKKLFFALIFYFIFNFAFELVGLGSIISYSSITLGISESSSIMNKIPFSDIFNNNSLFLGFLLVFFFIIKFFVNFINLYLISFFCLIIDKNIKLKILNKISKISYLKFISKNSSYFFNNYVNISTKFSNTVVQNYLNLISHSIITLGMFCFLLYLNFLLTIIFTLIVAIIYLIYYFLTKKKLEELGANINLNSKEMFKTLKEFLSDFKTSIIFNNFDFYIKNLNNLNLMHLKFLIKKKILVFLPKHIFELIIVIFFISFTMFYQSMSYTTGDTVIIIITYGFAALRVIPSINAINLSFLELRYANQPIHELYDLLNTTEAEKNNFKLDDKVDFNFKELNFKNVSFSYNNGNKILKNLNFTIKKGDFIGIYGNSGSGKTTLLDLLITLLNPDDGVVTINQENVNNFATKNKFRSSIAYISQNQFILDDTIKQNIIFRSKKIFDEKKFNYAIEKSNLKDLINSLEKKENTLMGENGGYFSGGQIQRVIIARSIYEDSQVLIFDEATNALDAETENNILKDLKNNFKDKTIIIVTHNLNLKRYLNKVFEIKNGEVNY
jgi:ABC-type multidrug transport system fused ATPase/permease subunit